MSSVADTTPNGAPNNFQFLGRAEHTRVLTAKTRFCHTYEGSVREREPGVFSSSSRKWRLSPLPQYSAVQYHRRCCLSALCSLSAALAPLRSAALRSLPRPRAAGAHTAARPAPLMHFSQPNDHPSLMGIAKECVNARPWGPQNISNFWGERRHELLLRFSGVVSSLQSRCRPRHLWSL